LRTDIFTSTSLENQPHIDLPGTLLMKCSVGEPGPTFVPSFTPVSESTEFCRK